MKGNEGGQAREHVAGTEVLHHLEDEGLVFACSSLQLLDNFLLNY